MDQTTDQVVAVEQAVQALVEVTPQEALVDTDVLLVQFMHQDVQELQDQHQV
tara:strand:+ start:235 stop:390 length:156 start_codon:yes stop_codon:yes gene_type:complete